MHENVSQSGLRDQDQRILKAYDLGVSGCIAGRAEDAFAQPGMQELPDIRGLGPDHMPMVFVCPGYIDGEYPKVKLQSAPYVGRFCGAKRPRCGASGRAEMCLVE